MAGLGYRRPPRCEMPGGPLTHPATARPRRGHLEFAVAWARGRRPTRAVRPPVASRSACVPVFNFEPMAKLSARGSHKATPSTLRSSSRRSPEREARLRPATSTGVRAANLVHTQRPNHIPRAQFRQQQSFGPDFERVQQNSLRYLQAPCYLVPIPVILVTTKIVSLGCAGFRGQDNMFRHRFSSCDGRLRLRHRGPYCFSDRATNS